jgi:redox-sensitive bicupin YhaK (pirin superfamily)
VSDVQSAVNTPIKINQDANIFVTEVEAGKEVDFIIEQGRQAYLLCIEGGIYDLQCNY